MFTTIFYFLIHCAFIFIFSAFPFFVVIAKLFKLSWFFFNSLFSFCKCLKLKFSMGLVLRSYRVAWILIGSIFITLVYKYYIPFVFFLRFPLIQELFKDVVLIKKKFFLFFSYSVLLPCGHLVRSF